MVAIRAAGSLEPAPWCGIPGSPRRGETFSSIIPIDTLDGRSRARSPSSITPGLACGNSEVSATTSSLISAT